MRERAGSARLLTADDLSASFVGWRSPPVGTGGIVNTKFGAAVLRVVVQKLVEGRLKDLYDQPIMVENPGAIVVCQAGDRVGLVQNYRFVGERLIDAGAGYVKWLHDEGRFEALLATLGRWCWELPRGLSPKYNADDIRDFVLATAKAEALEESGLRLSGVRIAGRVNANSTFYAHAQYVVHGKVVGKGDNRPEAAEMLGATKLFSAPEIRLLVDRGELDDGLTLAALAVCEFHF